MRILLAGLSLVLFGCAGPLYFPLVSTFSTALTQGATAIIIKALEDSGWFILVKRENLGNLLQEMFHVEQPP